MPKLSVNGTEVEFEKGMTVLQACEVAGEEIPRFCYHERLKIAGNCRMCLVQVEGGPPKPAASCAMPAAEGMKVHTNTPMVKKAREGVMEFLLANHPLDCPICDQAGECDLQDQSVAYGRGKSRFGEQKRDVKDKYMGPIIKTQMTRCIHCTRCVRFMDEVAGVPEMGATGRGELMEVGTYIEKGLSSELSGNIIDLCPVGALTSKPYAYKARPWELKKTETIDVLDAVGCAIRVDSRGNEVLRILPRLNEDINEEWISDKTRFAYEGLKAQRLDRPYVRENGKLKATSFENAINTVVQTLKAAQPQKIAALAGDLADVESMFVLKQIMQKLGSDNFDCRQDGAKYDATDRASYIFNTTIAGIEQADLVLLIGSNPRYEAPLLNSRIRKTWVNKKIKIAAIGATNNDNYDLTYPVQKLGLDTSILYQIALGNHDFCQDLAAAKNPVIIIGNDIFTRTDYKAINSLVHKIAEKYNIIRDDWNGVNVLQKAAARVGGLDVGFVPQSNSQSNLGLDTSQILSAAKNGSVDVLFLLGADEAQNLNQIDAFTIYIGSHGDVGANNADVILPASAYTEKVATYVNLEGRVQRTERAVFPAGEARDDYAILADILNAIGGKNYSEIEKIWADLAAQNSVFENIDVITKASFAKCADYSQELSNQPIISKSTNFYSTDPISRLSKTMNACNKEFGELKGFYKNPEDKEVEKKTA
jgi:NADH-quinone oxidoreductase subunit G